MKMSENIFLLFALIVTMTKVKKAEMKMIRINMAL